MAENIPFDDDDFFGDVGDERVGIGRVVPDAAFEAYHKGKIIKCNLKDFRTKKKWLILFFYPADFTFVCPTELEELALLYPVFVKEGAEVVSVSADTVYTHKAWHDQSPSIRKVGFPMAADSRRRLTRLFGVYREEDGLAFRGTFLIDPSGVLRAMEVHDNAIGRSAEELLRTLRAAKFVRENPGKVCPASWQPGGKTLTEGLDLVGKI